MIYREICDKISIGKPFLASLTFCILNFRIYFTSIPWKWYTHKLDVDPTKSHEILSFWGTHKVICPHMFWERNAASRSPTLPCNRRSLWKKIKIMYLKNTERNTKYLECLVLPELGDLLSQKALLIYLEHKLAQN